MGRLAKPKTPHPLDARPKRPEHLYDDAFKPRITDPQALEYVEHLMQWYVYHANGVPIMVPKHPYFTVVEAVDFDSDPGDFDAAKYMVTLWRDQRWPGTWSAVAAGVLLAILDVAMLRIIHTTVLESRYAAPAALQIGVTCQYVLCRVDDSVTVSVPEMEDWQRKFNAPVTR